MIDPEFKEEDDDEDEFKELTDSGEVDEEGEEEDELPVDSSKKEVVASEGEKQVSTEVLGGGSNSIKPDDTKDDISTLASTLASTIPNMATMSYLPGINLEKLNKKNWPRWRDQLSGILGVLGAGDAIKSDLLKATPKNEQANGIAKLYISMNIEDESLKMLVAGFDSAFDMYTQLKDRFEKADPWGAQQIRQRIAAIKFNDPARTEETITKLEREVSLLCLKATVSEEEKFNIFLAAIMTERYAPLVCQAQDMTGTKADLAKLKNMIVRHGTALTNSTKLNEIRQFKSKRGGRKCFHCDKEGHFKAQCPDLKNDSTTKNDKSPPSSDTRSNRYFKKRNVIEAKGRAIKKTELPFDVNSCKDKSVAAINIVTRKVSKATFILDNGATDHFVYDVNLLTDIHDAQPCLVGGIYKESNAVYYSSTVGTVSIKTNDGSYFSFQAYLVPELEDNYFSLSRFAKAENAYVIMNSDLCRVEFDDTLICVASTVKYNHVTDFNIVYLNDNEVVKPDNEATSATVRNLWHQRLGHCSIDRINQTAAILDGIKPITDRSTCGCCVQDKYDAPDFKSNPNPAKDVLDCVHSDLSGDLRTESINGDKYYITLIDEYSRCCQVYFLKAKSDAAAAIKNYVQWAERQTGKKLKRFKSDGGGEYVDRILKDYFVSNGIEHTFSSPYCPKTNGLAERKNRTLKDLCRTMMNAANLPKPYWNYGIRYANFISNRIVSTVTHKIPYYVFTGTKPSVEKTRVFGCKAFVGNHNQQKLDSFDSRRNEGVFLGVTEDHQKFIAYDFTDDRIDVHRNMHFIESEFPYKSSKYVHEFDFDYLPESLETELPFEETGQLINETDTLSIAEELEHEPQSDVLEQEVDETTSEQVQREEEISTEQECQPLPEPIVPRYPQRKNRGVPPKYYGRDDQDASIKAIRKEGVPFTTVEAMASPDRDSWIDAIQSEAESLRQHEVYTRVREKEVEKNILGTRWVFDLKRDEANRVVRHKARLVVKGYDQIADKDFSETYAPVGRNSTFRALLTLAASENYHVAHFDVSTAFLHSDVDHDIYVRPPPELEEPGFVWQLKRSLYGLKQSSRNWYLHLKEILKECDLEQSNSDFGLFYNAKKKIYVLIYVDDILAICLNEAEAKKLFEQLKKKLDIKDLGTVKKFLGWQVDRKSDHFEVHQSTYIDAVIEKFNLVDSKPLNIPLNDFKINDAHQEIDYELPVRGIIGCLQYLSYKSRPDITASVQYLSRHMHEPTKALFTACKNIVRYLSGTKHYRLHFGSNSKANDVELYTDASFGVPSVSGILLHWYGSPIVWFSRRQTQGPTSSAEAEAYALCDGLKELAWFNQLMFDLQLKPKLYAYCDNKTSVRMMKQGPTNTTKHIEISWSAIARILLVTEADLKYLPKGEMLADILTKSLAHSSIGRGGVLKVLAMTSTSSTNDKNVLTSKK